MYLYIHTYFFWSVRLSCAYLVHHADASGGAELGPLRADTESEIMRQNPEVNRLFAFAVHIVCECRFEQVDYSSFYRPSV